MTENIFHRAIYLTGPTASGKTAVGVALARRLNAEVVALDSMTLYRGMDIGTAKPTLADRGDVPHHLIDVIDPWQSASVAMYREWAGEAFREIEARGKRVLFVGGTPLYLKSLLRGLFEGPTADQEVRRRLEREALTHGDAALHQRLATSDPTTAARLHPRDRRRVVRALEVLELTGRPISELQAEHDQPAPPQVPVVALELPRASLHERINRRVVQFFDRGFVDEVRALQSGVRPPCEVAAQAIGYREVMALLAGDGAVGEAIERVQARTRQFAKRQVTWFRGLAEVCTVAVDPDLDADAVAALVIPHIEGAPNFGRRPT